MNLSPMEFQGDTKALFPAFAKAQKDMGAALKTATNPAFKSKYADLGAVIEAVLPALHASGFALLQPPHSDGALVEVETILVHESGGYIRSVLGVRPTKQDPQGIGSAITYARRYALQSIAGIAPEDDDGKAASAPAQKAAPAPAPQAPSLADRARRLVDTLNAVTTADALRKAYALASALRDDLEDMDPPRLAEVEKVYAERFEALTAKEPA